MVFAILLHAQLDTVRFFSRSFKIQCPHIVNAGPSQASVIVRATETQVLAAYLEKARTRYAVADSPLVDADCRSTVVDIHGSG